MRILAIAAIVILGVGCECSDRPCADTGSIVNDLVSV